MEKFRLWGLCLKYGEGFESGLRDPQALILENFERALRIYWKGV
jgi:hypothetical protein